MRVSRMASCVLASGVLLVTLGASSVRGQIQPIVRSAAIETVTASCDPFPPVPDALAGIVSPTCNVPRPIDLGVREVRPPSPERTSSLPLDYGRTFGPSRLKFWSVWAGSAGLVVLQVNATAVRANRQGAQQAVPPAANYALNLGVLAAGVAISYRWSRDEQTHGGGWWLFPAVTDVVQGGLITWAKLH
jgi:hypothetical protein